MKQSWSEMEGAFPVVLKFKEKSENCNPIFLYVCSFVLFSQDHLAQRREKSSTLPKDLLDAAMRLQASKDASAELALQLQAQRKQMETAEQKLQRLKVRATRTISHFFQSRKIIHCIVQALHYYICMIFQSNC